MVDADEVLGLFARVSDIRYRFPFILATVLLTASPVAAQRTPVQYQFIEVRGNGLTLGNVNYEPQSIIDFLGFEGTTFYLADASGNTISAQGGIYGISPHVIVNIPWDSENHIVSCNTPSGSEGMPSLLIGLLILPFTTLPILAAIGAPSPHRLWWLILSIYIVAQFVTALNASPKLGAIRENCESARQVIRNHTIDRADKSIVTPIHFAETVSLRHVLPNEEILSDLSLAPYKMVGAVLILLFQLRAGIAGIHYLTVRHPAERFVRSTSSGAGRRLRVDHEGLAGSLGRGDPRRPPPEFVSENQARRVRELTERFRAERELAEEAVRHARAAVVQREERKP